MWNQVIYQAIPNSPRSVVQTGPKEFAARYEEDARIYLVRFMQGGEGEEHRVKMLPLWDNQIIKVREAFGREMIPDPDGQDNDDVINVKTADGSMPDPTFERVMTHTLGDDPKEYQVRVHGGETPATIRDGLRRLHAGVCLGTLKFEDAEMPEEDPVGDWFSRTSSSDWRTNWNLEAPTQKFWLWTPRGVQDLGTEVLDGRTPQETWSSICSRTPGLGELEEYSLFEGQQVLSWNNLPRIDATFVRKSIAVGDRGAEFKLVDRNQAPLPRRVGPLVRAGCQLFTAERTMYGDQMEFDVPNEIPLPQLVAHYVLPVTGDEFDANTLFTWCLEIVEGKFKADKTKRTVIQIPNRIPTGFILRVRINSVHDGPARKQLIHCYFGVAHFHLAMEPDATVERLTRRIVEYMRDRGQG
jgi:hypothetical protein